MVAVPLDASELYTGFAPIRASHVKQFFDLFTGIMTDQNVVLKNGLTVNGTVAFDAGQIGTAEIATNAITQRPVIYNATSNNSSSSGTFANTIASVAITTTGGDLICLWGISVNASAGATVLTTIGLDAVSQGGSGAYTQVLQAATTPAQHSGGRILQGVSAAAHTITIMWQTSGGTIDSNGLPKFLSVIEVLR